MPAAAAFAARTVSEWLASPSHRAVLLSPQYRYVGLGLAGGYFGSTRAEIWVDRFIG